MEIKDENQKELVKEKYEILINKILINKIKLKKLKIYHPINEFSDYMIEQLNKRIKNYKLIIQNNQFYEEELQIFNFGNELNKNFNLVIEGNSIDKEKY